ncbi:MAG: FAD-binding protein [Alphaproteobacteria bacterium]|nr:FAD-binding protein [Alphaproteobacteria bacterium]
MRRRRAAAALRADPCRCPHGRENGAPGCLLRLSGATTRAAAAGVRVDEAARVLDTAHEPIAGLFAYGEMVGGLFHHNYPGGAGLVSGAVFGRIAGTSAAGNR